LLLGTTGCRRQPPPVPRVAAAPPSALMSVAPESALGPALPLFADDPEHPWNRLRLSSDDTAAARAAIEQKRARSDFKALQGDL